MVQTPSSNSSDTSVPVTSSPPRCMLSAPEAAAYVGLSKSSLNKLRVLLEAVRSF